MAYDILDNRNNKDLQKGLFASLSAIQGNQFGREVYSTAIQLKDLANFLEVFPEVQRDIVPRKVASIRRYVLTSDSDKLRFFSAIAVTCRGHAFYDGHNMRLAIDVANTKLSINDGQHRFEGVRTALSQLENDFLKTKNKEKADKYFLNKDNYKGYFGIANKWFDVVFSSLPSDINIRNKYIIDKSYTLKAIFKFVAKMLLDNEKEELIKSTIEKVDFRIDNKEWNQYDGRISEHGKIEFSGGTNGGYKAVYNILMDKLNGNLFDLDNQNQNIN